STEHHKRRLASEHKKNSKSESEKNFFHIMPSYPSLPRKTPEHHLIFYQQNLYDASVASSWLAARPTNFIPMSTTPGSV
ncbi:hypothetical protein ABTE87_22460, partial [Acinetobacter baumannii]